MIQRKLVLLQLLALLVVSFSVSAAEKPVSLRALLVTGGCCHDYETQKKVLTEGLSARANLTWTVVHEGGSEDKTHKFSVYAKPGWIKDYDVVVHNECSGRLTDVPWIEKIVEAHIADGIPAVMIHCSNHSYREAATDEWRKLLGVTSMRHQARRPFEVVNVKPDHPIMKKFPAKWQNGVDELYEVTRVWPNTVPLAKSITPKKPDDQHVSIWVNTYGKCKVFGTTLGHGNETMTTDVYLDLIARGLLWACDKLDESGEPKSGFGPN